VTARRLPPVVLGTGLLLAALVAESSQSESKEAIDRVVVVASKTERSIRQVAANVTVLDREALDLEMANTVADALRYVPGIDSESAGTRFGSESVNIRGIGGNRVALLIDGVPLGDQFDIGNFSNATRDFINAGFIRRIEVLHGPASALYGSSAIGGVVAMRTPDPADLATRGAGGALAANWRGTDASLNATALQAAGNESLGVLVGVGVRDGAERDPAGAAPLDQRNYQRRSAIAKLVADDASGNTWRLGAYSQRAAVTSRLQSMLGSGRFRSTTALEGDDDYRMDLAIASYEFGNGEGWIDDGLIRAWYGIADVDQRTLDERGNAARPVAINRRFSFRQRLRGVEANLRKTLIGDNHEQRFAAGLEYRERRTEEFRDGLETGLSDGLQSNVLLGETYPLRDFPISYSREWGAFFEDTLIVSNWTLIAALRADRFDLAPRDDALYLAGAALAAPVSITESALSPKLGLVYRFSNELDIYLQYSRGFRAPPYEDANIGLDIPLFNLQAIPNPDLKAESSDGFDIGVRWAGVNGSLQLSAFRNDYDNFIETKVRLGVDPQSGRLLFQSQNVQRARIEGIEANWNLSLAALADGLSLDGSAYLARGENGDRQTALNTVGPAQAVIGLGWSSPDARWQLRLVGTVSDRWDERDETGGELFEPPGYAIADLFVTRRFSERLMLRAGALNLGDRKYWAWTDVRGLAPDDPVLPYLARPGTTFTAGIDLRW